MTTPAGVTPLAPDEILRLMPHEPPMRFVDRIDEVDREHIVSTHTWTEVDCEGHFRDEPIVPGVKLIEFGAQGGIVAWLLYRASLELPRSELDGLVVLFTHLDRVRFRRVVRPGQTTVCRATFGDAGFYRSLRLKAEVRIEMADGEHSGEPALSGLFAGAGVTGSRLEELGR